ncbi:MAG: AAA family ATPase [Anaeromyxobacter sp.]
MPSPTTAGSSRLVARTGPSSSGSRSRAAQPSACERTPRAVHAVAITPDGKRAASGSADITIKFWDIASPDTVPLPRKTIEQFFEIARTITDRPDIRFLRVDQNFRVLVTAGEVTAGLPIEVLSQGLTSLFGWIGVLCQRLKETLQNPTNDPLPTGAFALVLIDELDAHMHPRWQQALVYRLKQSFPHVQFVACTHSPLIVGGLEKAEVTRFALQDSKVATVEFSPDMTYGRTDQVLAGELFDLNSTLDPRTETYIAEYKMLLGRDDLDDTEKAQRRKLERTLEARIPPSPTTPQGRRTLELLQSLDEVLPRLEESDRKKLAAQVRQLRETFRKGIQQ